MSESRFNISKGRCSLSKISKFRDIFKENAARPTDNHGMQDYLPFILSEEESRIRSEIDGCQVAVIFDGTSYFLNVGIIGYI